MNSVKKWSKEWWLWFAIFTVLIIVGVHSAEHAHESSWHSILNIASLSISGIIWWEKA